MMLIYGGEIKVLAELIKLEKSSIFFGLLAVIVWGHYALSAIILIILGVWSYIDREAREGILSDKKYFSLIIAVSGMSLISSAVALNFIGVGISFGVFFVLSVGGAAKSLAREKSFDVFCVLCCILSVSALVCAIWQKSLPWYTEGYRPTAGALNANYLGTLTIMTMCVALVRVFYSKPSEKGHSWYRPTRVFYIVVFLLDTVMLFLTESRSSLMAFMAAVALFLLFNRKYLVFSGVAVAGAIIWVVGWFYPDMFSWSNSLSFIITERAEIWSGAISSFLNPICGARLGKVFAVLFGRGPMTYYSVWQSEGLFGADHAHNLFFDSLINVGIFGTALYTILTICFIKTAFRLKNKSRVEWLLLSMLLVIIAVQGIVDVTVMWHQSAVMLFAVFGYSSGKIMSGGSLNYCKSGICGKE